MPIQMTGDGSHTIISPRYQVPYHSIHGALNETKHVFIKEGLQTILYRKPNISILEMGFGTGLNAAVTLETIAAQKHTISYEAIEAFPIDFCDFTLLNYADFLKPSTYDKLTEMHRSEWNCNLKLTPTFSFKKHKILFEDFMPNQKFDLIYFDAFAPTAQPELWSKEICEKLYVWLAKKGILVTYCAKGQFKRDLKSVGFKVESPPGPPGKREMTRAVKD